MKITKRIEIKIKDNHEPLVNIKKFCPKLETKGKTLYLRKTVIKMLCNAIKYLPADTTFIIGDAWRSQKIQLEIYNNFIMGRW